MIIDNNNKYSTLYSNIGNIGNNYNIINGSSNGIIDGNKI